MNLNDLAILYYINPHVGSYECHFTISLLFLFYVAFSLEECGRYLETIKVYENKPADIIQGHMDSDYLSRVCSFWGYCYHKLVLELFS